MSAMTMTARRAEDLHRDLRSKWGAGAFISICGGPHPTGGPAPVLKAGFDYACVGEGEDTIRDVAIALAGGGLSAISGGGKRARASGEIPVEVPGLFRLEDGEVAGRVRSEPVDLEACPPLPLRNRFPTHIEIGRGCRWGCAYCQTPGIHGHRERFRSLDMIERVVDFYARTGMEDFRFVLPNALGYGSERPGEPDCEALGLLLERVKSRARGGRIFLGSFPSEARPEYVSAEALGILREYVSNEKIVIGGQSGSQRVLDRLGRGHSVEDIRRACAAAIAAGFKPAIDLVLGFPGETAGDRRLTIDLIEELAGKGSRVNMHFFMPLPGTPLSEGTPVHLKDDERRVLDRLAQRGIVRGGWRRQEDFARLWVKRRPDRNHCP
jgi:B12-binding domain/radical SAM domain protein